MLCRNRGIATLNDELFILCTPRGGSSFIDVHDLDNLNAGLLKTVIELPEGRALSMAACPMAMRIYVCIADHPFNHFSIFSISKEAEKFQVKRWHDEDATFAHITVSNRGTVLVLAERLDHYCDILSVYEADGKLATEIMLPCDYCQEVVGQKLNGHFVLTTYNPLSKRRLLEVDERGSIVFDYHSTIDDTGVVSFADSSDRILLCDAVGNFEMLDSEFNVMNISVSPGPLRHIYYLYFNRKRGEVMCLSHNFFDSVLSIFRLKEK